MKMGFNNDSNDSVTQFELLYFSYSIPYTLLISRGGGGGLIVIKKERRTEIQYSFVLNALLTCMQNYNQATRHNDK